MPFRDRHDAGTQLAQRLHTHLGPPRPGERRIVLALPRGGLPVAKDVAEMLHAPLDVLIVRKLGAPGNEELALGAIASGGARHVDERTLAKLGIDEASLEAIETRERREIERREARYRGNRDALDVKDATVVLVDDGVATGSTMKAALIALRSQHPARILVAIPLAPRDTLHALEALADDVVCLETPEPFFAVAQGYDAFPQVDDATVTRILDTASAPT